MARSASGESIGANGTQSVEGEGDVTAAASDRAGFGAGSIIHGKYRLERLLGEGGMGAVWRAEHLKLDLPVAIKLLRPGTDRASLTERMTIEARAAARLVHPAIVRVFDVDVTTGGEPFIVMELLTGESLSELLGRGRVSGLHAVQLLLPIAEALVLAHGKGIVHRDLKPHNVFLAADGDRLQPKLLDFGIAKMIGAPAPAGSLTDTGVLLGSPDYMSPEQARGLNDIDHRADIWSFCVVLYEAIAGDTPFTGDNYNALMRAIVEQEPPPLKLDENLDQRLAELIAWGLEKDRDRRVESMQELGRELSRWLLDRGVKEDVTGSALGPKWITRTAQKSVPVIQPSSLPAPAPQPAVAVRTDTLLSPRLPTAVPAADGEQAQVAERAAPTPEAAARRRRLLPFAAALGLIGAAAWLLAAPRSSPERGSAAASASTAPHPAVAPASATSQTQPATSVQIAATPPVPSSAAAATSSTAPPRSSASNVNSASLASPASPAKQPRETSKRSPTAKPARDVHDDAHELLQAY